MRCRCCIRHHGLACASCNRRPTFRSLQQVHQELQTQRQQVQQELQQVHRERQMQGKAGQLLTLCSHHVQLPLQQHMH